MTQPVHDADFDRDDDHPTHTALPSAAEMKDTPRETPPPALPSTLNVWLAHSDAVAFLKQLPDASVDLVITDPPYESLEKHRAVGTTTRLKHSKSSSNDWFTVFPNARFDELFAEVFRVLKKNAHFYLFCDQETAFIAKPKGEAAGFKFWKPLVWDKCLHPSTPVWTTRGVVPLGEVQVGDRVATPRGQLVSVLAKRSTRSETLRIGLSDGTSLMASPDHRVVLASGAEVEAKVLRPGSLMKTAFVEPQSPQGELSLEALLSEEERVLELPDTDHCLFCDRVFETARACAAHQARHCEQARSKEAMAEELGISARRLRRWMNKRAIPATWARALGLESLATGRFRQVLANDALRTCPDSIPLDHALGRFVGLYAAEGSRTATGITFAFHAQEKHQQAHVAWVARTLGLRANLHVNQETNCTSVDVAYLLAQRLMERFVGGENAVSKFFTEAVYAAPLAFRDGVLDGLLEGDGSWSHEEQRQTLNVASIDLAHFALRELRRRGFHATLRPFSNDHAGGYRVRCDPQRRAESLTVTSIEELGEEALVDIAIDDDAQLYLLGNGLVTHNCQIGMGYHYRSRYELILFFEKGKRRLSNLGTADVFREPRIHRGYPTEKPIALSKTLITQSSLPGDVVVDPFMGTASTGSAALETGRSFIGSDISEKALAIARERLPAVVLPEGMTSHFVASAGEVLRGASTKEVLPQLGLFDEAPEEDED